MSTGHLGQQYISNLLPPPPGAWPVAAQRAEGRETPCRVPLAKHAFGGGPIAQFFFAPRPLNWDREPESPVRRAPGAGATDQSLLQM